jgi:hypothetical protein
VTTPGAAGNSRAGEFRAGDAAAAATRAVVDAIHAGQLSDGQLDGCGFWAAKAAGGSGREAATAQPDTGRDNWAGHGFTRPGPGPEVPRDLYQAALQDALAYTTDRDGCGDCDRDLLCETHTARAARTRQYQHALDEELEATT